MAGDKTGRAAAKALSVLNFAAKPARLSWPAKSEDRVQLNSIGHTVRNYLIRIFEKLGISSRVELLPYAFSGTEGNAAPKNPKTFSASA